MRRCGFPIVVFAIAVALLVGRLWDIQVAEHPVWAREAANLVRSHHVDPYVRGALRDRTGRVMVRDEEVYELAFVWRDFRQGHPLGQVAMARSLLFGRPLPLDQARRALAADAAQLVSLTPGQVEAFARGDRVAFGEGGVPSAVEEAAGFGNTRELSRRAAARQLRRRSRAGDLTYYVQRLLHLSAREERRMRTQIDGGRVGDDTYVTIASRITGVGPGQILADVRERANDALAHLERMAGRSAGLGPRARMDSAARMLVASTRCGTRPPRGLMRPYGREQRTPSVSTS